MNVRMNKNSRMFLMVAVSSLASQISLNMFGSGFILAMSPLMMSIFLYIFKDLNPFRACCLMTVFSPLVRLLVMIIQTGDPAGSAHLVLPDMGFFFGYAVLFAHVTRKMGYSPYHIFYLRLVMCDFFGNCCEQTLRVMSGLTEYTLSSFGTFAIIAFARNLIVILVCIALDVYMSLLERREHEENYKRLVLMASTFESEVYSMRKNMNEIEDIMTNAFDLYRSMDESYPAELRDKALVIAKDIHEVKKGYRRVIKGLQDNFLADFNDDSKLPLSDLLKILSVDVDRTRDVQHIDLVFRSSIETDYLIQKHFAFMSILRNLISNSIDALCEMPRSHRGEIYLRCRDIRRSGTDYCAIEVKDNGPGIPQEAIDFLFVPGYSTKYDEATGDINRGLGLTLALDLMETQFGGEIETSSGDKGTTFTLWFPVEKLTENKNSFSDVTIYSEDNAAADAKAGSANAGGNAE